MWPKNMDEHTSYLSFSLDQIAVDTDANEANTLGRVSQILEPSYEDNHDQTYYVVQTSDQYDIINQLEPSITNFEISKINDIDQSVYVNLGQYEINQNNIDLGDLDLHDVRLQNTIEDLNEQNEYFLNEINAETRDTVIKIVGTLNENLSPKNDLPTILGDDNENTDSVVRKETSVVSVNEDVKNKAELSDGNVWQCELCPDLRFGNKSTLNRHRWREHKPPPKVYACSQCHLTFSIASRLKTHMLSVHLCYRPHKCHLCTKSFYKMADLRQHIDTHTATKTYACPTCNRRFTNSSNLDRHELTHSKFKTFACPVCGKRYRQMSSLKKHRTSSAAAILGPCGVKRNKCVCVTCGESFDGEKMLLDHEKIHQENKKITSDVGRNVDALIQDILQEETNQIKEEKRIEAVIPTQEDLHQTNVENIAEIATQQHITDNNYEFELINEIDRLQCLTEVNAAESNNDFNIQSDFFNTSVDQTHLNNLTQHLNPYTSIPIIKDDLYNTNSISHNDLSLHNINVDMAEELLNIPKVDDAEIMGLICEQTVDECATIFESDVDLESSANLAANLNQLIAENNVEFVSTDDDDTFIINLNSAIDAGQLSDLLNIGIEVVEEDKVKTPPELETRVEKATEDTLKTKKVLKVPRKNKGPKIFTCKVCNKTFKKKDNYISHLGVHDPILSRYQCDVCDKVFGYCSSLNKHYRTAHTPAVLPAHKCTACGKTYKQRWMLKDHVKRKHEKKRSYQCSLDSCGKKFNKISDFVYHCRLHLGARAYACESCARRFTHASHRARHRRLCSARAWERGETASAGRQDACSIEMSKELLSDIDDLLKSKMDIA